MRTLMIAIGLVALLSIPGSAEAKPLTDAAIDRVVSKHSVRVRNCYIKHATSETGGKVVLELHIRRTGRVRSAKVHVSDGTAGLRRCIVRDARRWRFPRADTKTILHYPFVFKYTVSRR